MDNGNRGMAFVDYDNISIPAYKEHSIRRIAFSGLRNVLLRDLSGVGCTVYLPSRLNSFISPIQRSGLSVQVVSPGKSVDGRLIFDLLVNAVYDNFDVAVIASGDRDYIPVINEIKKMNKEVVLASFKYSMSQAIRDTANKVIELDDHISEITKQTFNYTCEDCGKDFFMTFELHGTTRCPDCHKKHIASRGRR